MENPAPDLLYAHRAKPYSSDLELRLTARALMAEKGKSQQTYALDKLERIRLSFSPRNTSKLTFLCEVRAMDGSSVKFDNLTWKSMIQTERQDVDFRAFVLALIERTATVNRSVRLEAGIGTLKFNLMRMIGFGLIAALAGATIFSATKASYTVAVGSFGLTVYIALWLRDFLTRNHPRSFTADAVPGNVLPLPPAGA